MSFMKSLLGVAAGAALSVGAATSAHANIVVLDFAGLNGLAQEHVENFYNGGTGSLGSGPGTNYGISFSSNAIACADAPSGGCNSADIPGGPGANLLYFLTGSASTLNYSAGFDTGFSFFYSAINNPGFVNVYDGLDGTGTLLATINLPTTPSTPGAAECFGAGFCPYSPVGVTFSGTARSVDFGGSANQIAFAAITFGTDTPQESVPEPASMALLGAGLLGLAGIRRRARAAAA